VGEFSIAIIVDFIIANDTSYGKNGEMHRMGLPGL
jgi:hypothetical protein